VAGVELLALGKVYTNKPCHGPGWCGGADGDCS
jgi:hypothetical protein